MHDETAIIVLLNKLDAKFPGFHEWFETILKEFQEAVDKETIVATVNKVLKHVQKSVGNVESIDNSKSMHMAMSYFILNLQRVVKVDTEPGDTIGQIIEGAVEEYFTPPPKKSEKKPDEPTLFTPPVEQPNPKEQNHERNN